MLKILRAAEVLFFLALFGAGAVILRYSAMLIVLIFIKDRGKQLKICSNILRHVWKFYLLLLKICRLVQIKLNDKEKIKNIKGSIIVANHPSLLDIVILTALIPYTTCFAAEKNGRNIFFKSTADLLFIVKSGNIEEWIAKASKFAEQEFNIVIFPAGSRHAIDEHPRLHRGAALLAQKIEKNIEVLKIENSFDFLAKNKPAYRISKEPVKYTISYAGAIDVKALMKKCTDEAELHSLITKQMSGYLYEMKR